MCVLSPVDHSFHCQLVFAPRFHVWSENSTFAPSLLPSFLFLHSYYVCNLAISLTLIHCSFVFFLLFQAEILIKLVCKINRSIVEIYFRNRVKICEKFKYIKQKYMTRKKKSKFCTIFSNAFLFKSRFFVSSKEKTFLTLNWHSHV